MIKVEDRIRNALRDADGKGKLQLVTAITGVSIDRLKAIQSGEEPTLMEKSMLGVHLR